MADVLLKCGECCKDKKGKVKLHYFDARGRGELIRWFLAYVDADWEDIRYTLEEWKNVKPTMPLGQVPVVEFICEDGKVTKVTQTATIIRAIAAHHGLLGKTPEQALLADEASEIIREAVEHAFRIIFEEDPVRKEKLLDQFRTEVIPRNFGFLEKRCQSFGGKSLAGGDELTFPAIGLAVLADIVRQHKLFDCDKVHDDYPGLAGLVKKVTESPQIEAWLAKRPQTEK